MSLTSPAGKPMPESAVAVVEAVGNQIGMVIENAQLYRQLRYLAVLGERDRLAREMHGTLGHRLTVAAVQLEGTQRLIPGEPRAARMVATEYNFSRSHK